MSIVTNVCIPSFQVCGLKIRIAAVRVESHLLDSEIWAVVEVLNFTVLCADFV